MPSSLLEPSPNLPMYIPGRRRMCSRQSSDRMLASLYSMLSFAIRQFAENKVKKIKKGHVQKIERTDSSLKKRNFRRILFISLKFESTNLEEELIDNSLVFSMNKTRCQTGCLLKNFC